MINRSVSLNHRVIIFVKLYYYTLVEKKMKNLTRISGNILNFPKNPTTFFVKI